MIALFLICFMTVAHPAAGQLYRKTSDDLFRESYAAQMSRQMGYNAAEIRAGEYRTMYETCDSHHNCGKSGAAQKGEERIEENEFRVLPFFYRPVMY